MPDAQQQDACATQSAPRVLNWPLVRDRCYERGATDHREAARLMGMAPRTLDRLRSGTADTKISKILRAATVLDLSLDEMLPPVDQIEQAA